MFDFYSNPISRYVLKLELKAETAKTYFQNHKFDKIANSIIGVREDVITANSKDEVSLAHWVCGRFVEIDKQHYIDDAARAAPSPCLII